VANHKSAIKSAKQALIRTERNRSRMSRIKTLTKQVEVAIESGNKANALEALKLAQPVLMSSVNKKLMNINTVARKISRLALRINKLA
jgi:small subunit ribosomal protein S20